MSPNILLFLGVVAHFIQQNKSTLSKALFGLYIIRSHSEAEQFNVLSSILTEYEYIDNLGIIIGDNATINNTLYCIISSWFEEKGKPE